jgi:hypothetical protein
MPAAGAHVWEHGNLAQKNLTVLRLAPGKMAVVPFVAVGHGMKMSLQVRSPRALARVRTTIVRRKPVFELPAPAREFLAGLPAASGEADHERHGGFEVEAALDMDSAGAVGLQLPAGTALFGLRLEVPDTMKAGSSGTIDVVQRDKAGRVLGGIAIAVEIGGAVGTDG